MSILYIRDKNGNFVQMPSVPGKSAYEIAVAKGTFSGTEQEFAEMQVINNKDIIDQITQENIDNWNSAKGMTDEEKEQLANKIDKVELTDDEQLIFYSEDKEISRIQLQGGMSDEEKEQLNTKLATKFDDVALNENETNDMQTALDFYSEGKVVKTAYFTGGSGGGSSTSAYISTELEENVMVGTDENFNLTIDFVSPNPGKGTLKVFINDVEAVSKSVGQGESTTIIEGAKFTKGTNRVTVYVIDRVGVMSNSLTFYIRYGSTEISSDFDQYSAYDYGATVRYYFTPTALDTSLTLTFYMSIDGQVQQGVACTSDTRGYYTFPTNLSADNHYCEAYIIDSNGMKSNVLAFNLIILNTNTLVVASDTKNKTIEEGEQLSLDYKAYMKNNTSFITKAYIDNNLVNTGTCNADFNYYRTSSLTEGIHTIKLEVWDITETYHDYVTWTITVTPSTYEMKQPVNAGAMFIGTAVNKTNTDERKQYFIGHNQEGNEVLGTLTNFAYNSESGWVNDELIISGNSHVEIPIKPLANNARYGFTLDIEFTSKQIGVPDAEVLTLWNNETNCGIKITTEKLILQSSNGNKCDLYFTDNERTHVMFIIDRQELKAKIYLNGVMCEAFHLNDYTVDGVAYLDDFTVNSNIVLGGLNKNGYCKIRNLRVYQVALTTDEIINNFISCEIDKGKQRELVEFQKGNDLPTLYVYCDFSGLGKDDKKPCKIVYNSTNVEKYGESFTLNHKQSQLQYQGTSSMAYPIKNYRLNLRDEKGKKWYYNFPGGQGECRFTLKADFMSSGHWTNTGMAKFINDNLYNYKSDDEKSMNPFRWYHVQNGDDVSNYRETINGFPCRLILINDGSTPLNEGQNEPTPGNTKDMGIFNFNNDKDNVTTLGFDSDIFPNCASYEVTANSDTSAGAFMSYSPIIPIDYYCPSGGDYSFSVYLPSNLFLTKDTNTINSDVQIVQIDYHLEDKTWKDYKSINNISATLKSTEYSYIRIKFLGIPSYITFNDIRYPIGNQVSDNYATFESNISYSDELAYLKESFELRHPDEDDVAEDWGFMGVEEDVNEWFYESYVHSNGMQMFGTYISKDFWETNVLEFNYIPSTVEIRTYDSNKKQIRVLSDIIERIELSENEQYIMFLSSNQYNYININGIKYNAKIISIDEWKENNTKNPYKITTKSFTGGLKALIDWVDNCTDEEFVNDFEQHFHKDYTLRYYCLVVLCGMVDNMGKNMMLDTADNKIFFPRFYDIDTCCSYDNSGQLKFDVDIEMEQGYWNTSSSRLWTRIRDLMHDDIVTTYNDMRQNGVSYENMMKYIYDEQIAKIPQVYFNKDYDIKYAPFADSYIGMAHGDTYEHVKRWLKQRFTFVDTLFDYAPSYNNDVLTIRANTTELMTLEIETYTPVYQHLSWYNGQMDKKKIDGKVSVEFSGTAQAATDQEVLIYGGSNVKSIKGITSMNPNRMLIGSATKLIEIDAHDCPLLADINANKANLSPHEYLNKVNLSNCPLLEGNLRLNNSPLVQEINIKGTNITGMNLPSSIRNLQTLRLPNTMTDLTLNDASMLHTLEFDGGVTLQSISMTNCNALENVIGFDLLQTPSITLNNSYNTVAELYFRDTTNLSLSNMSNLERVIFTPNNEYETFELINVANAPDYKVTTFNCPKLSTFMTTAPYRESYNTNYSYTYPLSYEVKNAYYKDGVYTNVGETYYHYEVNISKYENMTHHIKAISTTKQYQTIRCTYFNNSTWISTQLIDNSVNVDEDIVIPNDCNKIIFVCDDIVLQEVKISYEVKEYGDIQPNITFTANSIDISNTQFTDVKLLCTTDTNVLKLPTTVKNFYCDSSFDLDTDFLEDGEYDVVHGELIEPYTTDYEGEVLLNNETPNLIPSSADGSLIFSMYAPSNAVAPASGTWDLKGLEFDNFHTFGMNNNVKGEYEVQNIPNFEGIVFTSDCYKGTRNTSTYAGYFQMGWLNLNNATVITSDSSSIGIYIPGSTFSYSSPTTITESCVALSFYPTVEWVKIIENGTEYHFEKSSLELGTKNVSLSDKTAITLSVSSIVTGDLQSITMPARYDDYNITIKNANISPKTHNTMLYPLLVNEDNPITGTLDYTNYAGKHLSWSFAYTDEDYVNIMQPIDELLNSYEYRYNAFYDTEYEFDNPYEVAKYTSSASGVLPSFNAEFTYTYDEIDNGDGTYTVSIATDSLDNLPTSIRFNRIATLLTVDKLNTSNVTSMYLMFRDCKGLTSLNLSNWDTSNVTDMNNMFYYCPNLTSLDISNWDTSNVTDMNNMFYSCSKLTSLDVSGFDTSNVTNMGNMFHTCSSLTSLDVSSFDTSNVTNMAGMFQNCNNLTSLDVSGFDTSKVTDMTGMFRNCNQLTSLDVSGFDTGNVTNMASMFSGCSNLTSLDVSGFDTGNVTNMASMFYDCSNLTSLDLSNFDTSNVTTISSMFANCQKLTEIIGLENWDTSQLTQMSEAFNQCYELKSLQGIENWNVEKLNSLYFAFRYCKKITSLNLSNWNITSALENIGYVFMLCESLEYLDLSNWDVSNVTGYAACFSFGTPNKIERVNLNGWTKDKIELVIPILPTKTETSTVQGTVVIDETTLPSGWIYEFDDILEIARYTSGAKGVLPTFNAEFTGYDVSEIYNSNNNTYTVSILTDSIDNLPTSISFYGKTKLLTVDKLNTKNVTRMNSMFDGCSSLISLDVNGFNTSKVTTMNNMFYNCSGLTSLDVSGFDTGNVTNMSYMFSGCSKLTSLDVSGFDTGNVTNMGDMFYNCSGLTSLDVSGFDTSKVTTMGDMFYSCSKLTSLDVSGFDTSKVTTMGDMFAYCSGLTSLDVSGFDIRKVTNMGGMFRSCSKLTSLDLSAWNNNIVTNMSYMFYNCSSLTSLDISNIDVSKATNPNSGIAVMFQSCSALTSLNSMKNISASLYLSSTKLDATSLLDVIDNLASLKVVVNEVNCTLIESGGTDMETGEIKSGTSCVSDETFYEVYAGKTYEINTNGSWLFVSYYYANNKAFRGSLYSGANNTNDSCIITPSENGYIRVSAVKAPNANTTITIKECILNNPQTLTLGSTLLAKLTEEQIAIAVNKGWTVS